MPPVSLSNLSGMIFRRLNNEKRSLLYVSPGCTALTGYQQEELTGDGCDRFYLSMCSGYASITESAIKEAVEKKIGYEISYQIVTAQGEVKWVAEEGMPVYETTGECKYIEGIIRDITGTKQLENSLRHFNSRLKLINDIARELVGKLPLQDMVHKMLTEIISAFSVDAGIVRVIRDEALVPLTKVNVPEQSILPRLPVNTGLAGKMIDTKAPVVIKNTNLDPVTIPLLNRHPNEFKFISYAGAPLIVQEKIIGIIGLYTVAGEREFSEEDLQQLQIAANHIGAAIENNRLFTDLEKKKRELEAQIEVRKEAEDALFESRAKLNLIISAANLVLYQREAGDGRYQYISPAIEKITGYTPAEIYAEGLESIILTTENFKQERAGASAAGAQPGEYMADYLVRRKDNALCWLSDHSYPWYDSAGGLIGSIGVLTEITERKSIEKLVREEKNKSQQLMDNSPVAIALLNTDGAILSVNDAFCRLFGYEKSDIYNINIDDLAASPDPAGERFSSENSSLQNVIHESLRKKYSGELVFVQRAAVPVISDGKALAEYRIYIDLTERLKAEEEIRAAKNKAEEASRIKSNFLANMSHELRTPLIGVLGYSEILMEEAEDKQIQHMAVMINNGGQRLLENLNLILDMSRVESGKVQTEKKLTKVQVIIEEVIGLFSEAANKKGLYIRQYTSNVPEILTDPKMLRQILNNLVNNAIKFTHEGGISIFLHEFRHMVMLQVQDTGVGISENDQKIIWDEFRQASEGFGRTYEGTGLGLSITRKFVTMLGGRIYVESEPGKGSTFTVELPYSGDSVQPEASEEN